MLLQHSRRHARVRDGELVLLPDQDRSLWVRPEIDEAIALLTPLAHAPPAPYLLQALIAAEHALTVTAAETDWPRIAERYAELDALTGSPVVRLNRAVAVAEADGPLAGLALLDGVDLPGHRLPGVRGELLLRAERYDDARAAFDEAIAACANDAERAHLVRRRAAVPASGLAGGASGEGSMCSEWLPWQPRQHLDSPAVPRSAAPAAASAGTARPRGSGARAKRVTSAAYPNHTEPSANPAYSAIASTSDPRPATEVTVARAGPVDAVLHPRLGHDEHQLEHAVAERDADHRRGERERRAGADQDRRACGQQAEGPRGQTGGRAGQHARRPPAPRP